MIFQRKTPVSEKHIHTSYAQHEMLAIFARRKKESHRGENSADQKGFTLISIRIESIVFLTDKNDDI